MLIANTISSSRIIKTIDKLKVLPLEIATSEEVLSKIRRENQDQQ
jgi:hypothetical protein